MTTLSTFHVTNNQNGQEINLIPQDITGAIYLTQMVISLSFYSVRNGFNSKLHIDGTDLFIPEGTYSHLSLRDALRDVLTAYDPNFNVQFNGNQDKFTITRNTSFTIDFTLSDPSTYRLLGYNQTSLSGTSIESTNSPRLRDSFLKLQLETDSYEVRPYIKKIIFPIIGSFRDNMVYYDPNGTLALVGRGQITKLKVSILDENDNLIDLRFGDYFLYFHKSKV